MLDLVGKLLGHVLEQSRHDCGLEWGNGVDHLLQPNWYLAHPAEQLSLSQQTQPQQHINLLLAFLPLLLCPAHTAVSQHRSVGLQTASLRCQALEVQPEHSRGRHGWGKDRINRSERVPSSKLPSARWHLRPSRACEPIKFTSRSFGLTWLRALQVR